MGDQLHALTAVLPGKWAISHSKHGCVAPGLVKTGRTKRKCLAPHWGSNLTVQPVASSYTVYSIPSPSHTAGDGMSMAYRTGKILKIILH